MGTWGVRPFENDKADDWISYLVERADLDECRSALRDFKPSEWECGVAAAEAVATAAGRPGAGLPAEVAGWLATVDEEFDGADVTAAFRITDEVLMSGVRELFDDPTEWLEVLDDMRHRLRSAAHALGAEVE